MLTVYNARMSLRIRQLRTEKRLSQEELAEKAGLSRSQLSEIETEKKPANTRRLGAIAAALGVEMDDLFEPSAQSAYTKEIMTLFEALGEADREAILRMARALAASG